MIGFTKATENYGLIGHVANGKSKTAEYLSKRKTNVDTRESKQGITMKTNYADCLICKDPSKASPDCYFTVPTDSSKIGGVPVKRISLLDCPGHSDYMKFMFNGTNAMDKAIVVMSVEHEHMPAPQTIEHLTVIKEMGIPLIAVLVNKCDNISPHDIESYLHKAADVIEKMGFPSIPIIPTCANLGVNLDVLLEVIVNSSTPDTKDHLAPVMSCIRSFDHNTGRVPIEKMIGGTIGGTISSGTFSLEDDIMIYPGVVQPNRSSSSKWKYIPLSTKIVSMMAERSKLEKAGSGGLVAMGTLLDPSLTTKDCLVGSIVVKKDDEYSKPHVYESIYLVDIIIGSKYDSIGIDKKNFMLEEKDNVVVNSNAQQISANIKKIYRKKDLSTMESAIRDLLKDDFVKDDKEKKCDKDDKDDKDEEKFFDSDDDSDNEDNEDEDDENIILVEVEFTSAPLCAPDRCTVSISKKIGRHGVRLVGHGAIKSGKESIQ